MPAIDLGPHLNNRGLSAPGSAVDGGLDGMGTYLRRDTLPRPGTVVRRHGVVFRFSGAGARDNVGCEGQQVALRPGRYAGLHVLGMCDWRSSEEVLCLRYADGCAERVRFGLSDAVSFDGPRFGERPGLRGRLVARDSLVPHAFLFGVPVPDSDYQMQETAWDAVVWHQTVPVDPRRTLVGCDLPDNPAMHLFGLTLAEDLP